VGFVLNFHFKIHFLTKTRRVFVRTTLFRQKSVVLISNSFFKKELLVTKKTEISWKLCFRDSPVFDASPSGVAKD